MLRNLVELNLHPRACPSLFLCWKGTLISQPTNSHYVKLEDAGTNKGTKTLARENPAASRDVPYSIFWDIWPETDFAGYQMRYLAELEPELDSVMYSIVSILNLCHNVMLRVCH